MESLAYLHLALAYDDPTTYEFVLGQRIQQLWQKFPWKLCSSKLALRFLSLATTLAILTLAQAAFAIILKEGNFRPEVSTLKQQLQQLGYYRGEIDNYFGSSTEAAVLRFQRDQRIQQDGQVGPETQGRINRELAELGLLSPASGFLARPNEFVYGQARPQASPQAPIRVLNSPPVNIQNFGTQSVSRSELRLGDIGPDVRLLQQRLQSFGIDPGPLDGVYGSDTQGAVALFQNRFQNQFNLFVRERGVADEQTLIALGLRPGSSGFRAGGEPKLPRLDLQGLKYVVVIPTNRNRRDTDRLDELRTGRYPNAQLAQDRRGKYIYVESYLNFDEAQSNSAFLRSKDFRNARVVYFH